MADAGRVPVDQLRAVCRRLIGEHISLDTRLAPDLGHVRINRAQYLMRSVDREYRIQMPDGSVVTSHAVAKPASPEPNPIPPPVFSAR